MEVSFPSSDRSFRIFGDLTLPKDGGESTAHEPIPAILVIAGSGPLDRNGNVSELLLRMDFNTSNQIAEHMVSPSERPIAVLSYDKRGVGKSIKKGDKNFYYRAGMMDLVSDAVEAIRFLAGHPRIDEKSIALLGHSEGAILLPLICEEARKAGLEPVKGCIFYAGLGETVEDATKQQRERILDEVQRETGFKGWLLRRVLTRDKLMKQHADLMAKINSDGQPDFVSSHCGLVKTPAKWYREHMSFDTRTALADITCHCLAITGCKDVQVRDEFCMMDRAAVLVPKAASIEVHRPANLTHALRSLECPSKILNVKQDYSRLGKKPLDPELLSITRNWCDRVLLGSE
uniref:Serine aminopeptidase S33 domain-containing protein n=1 Tax=Trieres chinensis TaxID=1514140 RepID=A0A7S2A7D3_TRICV|mmetsp:Transcript_5745/g.11994  ORF Transcript_5745/g.11994 Transcript_5745/m.11994 type:complete len:346 (+) Transcript_5745:86-1123(+)|eukprot:CAMPEP_0183308604 /NCGR_PEP_ID=MMETSP0160_2-20130417/22350_1 /TAXON_ID=2839 ORGANISM="Odontella Sinensis, Strain Grunow 1884" /NCGR_SAMPLE_ID=MMETSP0160_2 /ASSEMBLY_ACC=CAM_ASM_000250 /LENGTH=345 /DNA_ID=CAMNT_0025472465 /DNA_START=86 /DNA_END=1123 /DNA_ORIENTATION=+